MNMLTRPMQSLTPQQVEELHDDIEKYLRLEQSETNLEFWTVCARSTCLACILLTHPQNMMVITKDALDRIKQTQRLGATAAAAVEADITALLQGKSYEHLVQLQKQIQAKLASGEPIDTDYWEGLLKKLLVFKAKVLSNRFDRSPPRIDYFFRLSCAPCTKLSFATVSSSSGNVNETRPSKLRRSCWQVSRSPLSEEKLGSSPQTLPQNKTPLRKSSHTIAQ